jgi:hypothetical protein
MTDVVLVLLTISATLITTALVYIWQQNRRWVSERTELRLALQNKAQRFAELHDGVDRQIKELHLRLGQLAAQVEMSKVARGGRL